MRQTVGRRNSPAFSLDSSHGTGGHGPAVTFKRRGVCRAYSAAACIAKLHRQGVTEVGEASAGKFLRLGHRASQARRRRISGALSGSEVDLGSITVIGTITHVKLQKLKTRELQCCGAAMSNARFGYGHGPWGGDFGMTRISAQACSSICATGDSPAIPRVSICY